MSATRDKSQKTTFVYSNLYQIYRKGKDAANASPGLTTSQVIKAADASATVVRRETAPDATVVRPYNPAELMAKRMARPAVLPQKESKASPAVSTPAVHPLESLKQNMKDLNDLQARLRFMLQELEDLVKE